MTTGLYSPVQIKNQKKKREVLEVIIEYYNTSTSKWKGGRM